jgi:integrase
MPELRVLDFPSKPKKEKKRRKYEMPDGTYKAKPMINGKRHTVRGKSTKEVEEKIAELKRELKGGADPALRNITVEEWAKRWYEAESVHYGSSNASLVTQQLKLINSQIGSMRVRDVRLIHLKKIMNQRAGQSESYINKLSSVIKRLFCAARQNQIITIDPAIDLKKIEGTYSGHRCLEPHEVRLLLDNWRCCPAGVWAVTMMLSGIRRGECLALRAQDFDFERGVIHIRDAVEIVNNNIVRKGKTKTKAGMRDTPMLEPLTSIIREDFERNPREAFVQKVDGAPITASTFRTYWDTLMRMLTNIAAGYEPNAKEPREAKAKAEYQEKTAAHRIDFDRHDLRHTYATFLFESGVDEKSAVFYLGHTSAKMTRDLYAHLRAEQLRKSDTNLATYFKKFSDPT